ncbi:PQQ-dependent sugar dehydrogenase [Nitrosococcus watsonii]|uniref:L-sorbosone dehydrogenase n=1 Tax=Nitrosococcus watsoni (strain C-113) TaxID=105559 RepID=D8K4I8_NITWC|nr:PQQ-dependent sugar dehydrogenase [Nitrosococcus watsonii]ADJ27885.1 L-sorbosone dehydrogenase [Nitrosococcus watsonii C-113]
MAKSRNNTLAWGVWLLFFWLPFSSVTLAQPVCDPDNGGLTLPQGFCALVVADKVGKARHLTVASNGDVLVALDANKTSSGGVLALRDTSGDGVADLKKRFGSGSGDDVKFHDGYLYFATHEKIVRYPWRNKDLEPAGPAETIVEKLPATASHQAKSIAFGPEGKLYVNIGSPSNACQKQDRTAGSPGKEPCDELATRAGIWRFEAGQPNQKQQDGSRFATGLRNTVALALRPQDGQLYGVIHGRDQLSLWPQFNDSQNAEKPSEELVRIQENNDFGWPYCYHDPALNQKVLAPEYGGDGKTVDRCQKKQPPLLALPAHWAPNGLLFYSSEHFPKRYRGGAFIAFHGSWNRAPLPQGGYNIVFVPFKGKDPTGEWEVFAEGFASQHKTPRAAEHRPVGVAEGPDGSLYISDDQGGRIYRILYRP